MKWKEYPIEEVALGIYDGPHATPKEAESGAIFLGIRNITEDCRLDFSDIRFISLEELPKWTKRVKPRAKDIVFSYEATLHRYAIIPEGFEGCLGRRMALIRPDLGKVDYQFLYYYLRSENWIKEVSNYIITGSTVDRIPILTFPKFKVQLPTLPTQQKIATILSAYDDLIENNLKRIRLLEEAAQHLYREWFVRFRFPGWEGVRWVEGLPEGWERKALAEVAATVVRGVSPKYVETDGFTVINQKCIRNQTLSYEEARLTSNATTVSDERILKQYDILVNSTGLGTLGRVAQVLSVEFKQTVDSHVTIVRANTKFISPLVLGFEMKKQQPFISGLGKGSTNQTELSRSDLKDLVVVNLPPMELQKRFEEITKTILSQIFNLQKQTQNLKTARDLLLPRLMNQTITV